MDKNERKMLCLFAVVLATFTQAFESQESKEEFVVQLDTMRKKVLADLSKVN